MYNLNLKRTFKWEMNKGYTGRQKDTPFPLDSKKGITVKEALTKFIDFKGPLSKKMLKELVRYCRSLDDREKCEKYAKLGGKCFEEELLSKHKDMIDLKGVLPSLFLPIEFILQKLPTIMPRYFTIASSSLANPKDLAIAISLTRMALADGTSKLGLTSKYF